MPIPEAQLQVWANQGGTASAQAAYASVRAALSSATSPPNVLACDVYLQGSYRNDTNVRADSDVDVVAEFDGSFGYDTLALPPEQVQRFHSTYVDSSSNIWTNLRTDVLSALRSWYGTNGVEERSRCIKVLATSNRLAVDVIPALQYRRYSYFWGPGLESYVGGVRFYDRAGRSIINYPKAHYENGVAKNSLLRTAGRFKRTVRMFKNARTAATDRGYLNDGVASSYFIDCLIWNVPDDKFVDALQDTYCNVVNYLHNSTLTGFMCRNGIVPLFGTTPEQWSEVSARQLVAALARLWNEWY
jgi:hypothetical protein